MMLANGKLKGEPTKCRHHLADSDQHPTATNRRTKAAHAASYASTQSLAKPHCADLFGSQVLPAQFRFVESFCAQKHPGIIRKGVGRGLQGTLLCPGPFSSTCRMDI